MQYLDFEVRVSAGDGGLYAVDVASPAGEARGSMKHPFSPATLERELQSVELAVVRSGARTRDIGMAEPGKDPVVRFGKQLFDALFSEQVKEMLRRSQDRARGERKGLRIRLRIDAPELSWLPWEYLYDSTRGDYVGLSTDSPLVRYMECDRPAEALAVQPPIRVLAMIASPNDRGELDVQHERKQIEDATAKLRREGTLQLDWLEGSTWRDLQRKLRNAEYHIFHFVGHGTFDAAADEGMLAFTNDTGGSQLMSAKDIGRLLADEDTLRLVVLNSCLGAKGSDTNVFSSTSATLVRKGVPAVVAMQYEITDRAAIEFSRSMYEAIADGWPIDAAVAEARKAVSLSARNSLEWGTPVLHMRSPDGMLFRIDAATLSKATAQGERGEKPAPAGVVDFGTPVVTQSVAAAQPGVAVPPPASTPAPLPLLTPSTQGGAAVAPAARRPKWLIWTGAGILAVLVISWLIPDGTEPVQDAAPPADIQNDAQSPVAGVTVSPELEAILDEARQAKASATEAADGAEGHTPDGEQAAEAAKRGEDPFGTMPWPPSGTFFGDVASYRAREPAYGVIEHLNGNKFAGLIQYETNDDGTEYMSHSGTDTSTSGHWKMGIARYSETEWEFAGSSHVHDGGTIESIEGGDIGDPVIEGVGEIRYADGTSYLGYYRSDEQNIGVRHGLGAVFGADGQIVAAGNFVDGEYVGPQ